MADTDKIYNVEKQIIHILKNTFDPEIPVNVYDLGLIYEIDVDKELNVKIVMTLTAPNCPMVDELISGIYENISGIQDVKNVDINLTFDPPWTTDMMSDEAKLELGYL
ncbi:MAG TPA: DUF59 domain-containing protein [Bacteroidales bacterium]|nr:DUF59 domain-containing protein [Bacteroidales bacterium]